MISQVFNQNQVPRAKEEEGWLAGWQAGLPALQVGYVHKTQAIDYILRHTHPHTRASKGY